MLDLEATFISELRRLLVLLCVLLLRIFLFNSYKSLEQVNATIHAIIPKVQNPSTAIGLRPIACHNKFISASLKLFLTG